MGCNRHETHPIYLAKKLEGDAVLRHPPLLSISVKLFKRMYESKKLTDGETTAVGLR